MVPKCYQLHMLMLGPGTLLRLSVEVGLFQNGRPGGGVGGITGITQVPSEENIQPSDIYSDNVINKAEGR